MGKLVLQNRSKIRMKYFALVLILCLSAQFTICQAPVMKAKGKVAVKAKVAVPKISIGGSKKVSVKKPKVSVPKMKVTVKKPAVVAKPSTKGKVNIKITKKVAAKPKVVLKGTCPQAKAFGMIEGPATAYKKGSIRMCPDMTSSCCTKASMATYYSSIRMSAIFWSVSRSLSASVQLYGGLSSKLVAAAAKIPKRRLQKGRSSVRKSSSRKVKAV